MDKPRDDIIIYLVETKENNFPKNIQNQLTTCFHIEKKPNLQGQKLFHYIKNIFHEEHFQINDNLIFFLMKKTKDNLFWLHEIINKIKTYHLPHKQIDDENILEKLIYNENQNIFLLIKFLINNQQPVQNLLLFQDLIKKKIKPIIIVQQTIQKLQDMIITKHLINKKYSQEQIAIILKYSSPQTYFLIKEISSLNLQYIQNLFLIFIDLYYKIQKKLIDAKTGLEMFFINKICNEMKNMPN